MIWLSFNCQTEHSVKYKVSRLLTLDCTDDGRLSPVACRRHLTNPERVDLYVFSRGDKQKNKGELQQKQRNWPKKYILNKSSLMFIETNG